MRLVVLAFLGALVLAGCAGKDKPSDPHGGKTASLTTIPDVSDYSLGEPVSSGGLTVVPIVMKSSPPPTDDYATLAEAMKHDWVEIFELPGGSVNLLRVRNTGPKPLLLLGGELLIGGKQDRVVSKDTIVPPGKTVEVMVNCVEHGRWQGSSLKFESSGMMVPPSVRAEAGYGSQEGVWSKVSEYNRAAQAPEDRSTVQAGLANERVRKAQSDDLEAVLAKLDRQENVVGVLVVVGGEIQTLDVFGSPTLFAAARSSLLKGALSQAAFAKTGAGDPTLETCAKFASDCLTGRRRLTGTDNGVNGFDADGAGFRGREIAGADYEARPAAKSEGLVHGNYTRVPVGR